MHDLPVAVLIWLVNYSPMNHCYFQSLCIYIFVSELISFEVVSAYERLVRI